jgi:hypothetical protein
MTIISQMIESAATKPAFTHVTDTEETIRRVQPNSAHDLRYLNLKELSIAHTINDGPDSVYTNNAEGVFPGPGHPGYNSQVAINAIAQNSVVVGAGASIVLIEDAVQPKKDPSGGVYMTEQPAGFITAIPANFQKVIDGENTSDSELPVYRDLADRSIIPSYFFRVVLSRRQQKDWMEGQLESSLLYSIIAGVGKVADRVLLESLMTANVPTPVDELGNPPIMHEPSVFSIAAAAAKGVRIGDLRAIIGTNGAGASFNGMGQLTAAGIKAELSSETSATLIGDWSTVAVGILGSITLIAQRVDFINGQMAVTAIVNARSLIPTKWTPELRFWTVS